MVYPLKPGSVILHLVKKGRKYSRIYISMKKLVKKAVEVQVDQHNL
jgi:hypothetical protein